MDGYDQLTREELISLVRSLQGPGVSGGPPVFSEEARRSFEASPRPMRIFDCATLRYLAVNDAGLALYGYTREEFLALRLPDTRHPDDRAGMPATAASRLRDIAHWASRRQVTKSGEELRVETITQDIRFDGRFARLSVDIDVTERYRALALLRRQEQEFHALMDHTPDIVARLDRDFRHVYVNPAIVAAVGRSPEDFIGKGIDEVGMPPELVARWRAVLQEAFLTGREQTLESLYDGQEGVRHYESRIVPERDPDGTVATVLTITRDFTERRKAEELLWMREQEFESLAENLPDLVARYDREHRFLYINSAMEKVLGLDRTTTIGMMQRGAGLPEELAALYRASLDEVFRSGQPNRLEFRLELPTGERFFEAQNVPEGGARHRVETVLSVARDITERKRADEALRTARESLEVAVRGGNVGLWGWDIASGVTYYSPEWKRQIGYEDHELSNRFEEWNDRLHPEDRARVSGLVGEFMRKPWPDYQAEFRLRHRDGSYRWILSRAAARLGESGSVERMYGCHVDITFQKQLETERLERAIRERDALVREVHHRIKNSLQGVIGLLRQKIRRYPAIVPGIEEAIAQLQSVAVVYGIQGMRPDGLLSLAEMLEAICFSAESLTGGRVEMHLERESPRPVCVAGSEAVSVAVALNELVFNSLKHQQAASGRKRSRILLHERGSAAEIRIVNRGRLPPDFDFDAGRSIGDGLGLVRTLLTAPGGDVRFDSGPEDVEVVLTLGPPLIADRQPLRQSRRQENGTVQQREGRTAALAGGRRRPARAGRAG